MAKDDQTDLTPSDKDGERKGRRPPVAERVAAMKAQFLDYLETGNVTSACRGVGRSRATLYEHREKDLEFAAEWDKRVEIKPADIADLRHSIFEIARNGVEEPVFFQGEEVGTVRRYFPTLMRYMYDVHVLGLTGREGIQINVDTGVLIAPRDVTPAEWVEMAAEATEDRKLLEAPGGNGANGSGGDE